MMFQVMVEGRLPPKVKRDAHDVILEFIRSRPPLKPVSELFVPFVCRLAGVLRLTAIERLPPPLRLRLEFHQNII